MTLHFSRILLSSQKIYSEGLKCFEIYFKDKGIIWTPWYISGKSWQRCPKMLLSLSHTGFYFQMQANPTPKNLWKPTSVSHVCQAKWLYIKSVNWAFLWFIFLLHVEMLRFSIRCETPAWSSWAWRSPETVCPGLSSRQPHWRHWPNRLAGLDWIRTSLGGRLRTVHKTGHRAGFQQLQ